MSNLKGSIINEIEKLLFKKKILGFSLLMLAVSFLSAFFISIIQERLSFIAFNSISFPIVVLSIMTNFFLPLFIFLSSSEIFSGEESDKTTKLSLTRPISRFKIFLSKNLALTALIVGNLILILLVSCVSALFLKLNIDSFPKIIFSYLIDIIPAIILALFASLIAQFFKNSSGALITSILLFVALILLSLFIKGFNNVIFISYLNWYSQWFTSGGSKFLSHLNLLFMLIAYGMIFFTLGFYFFDKKEY